MKTKTTRLLFASLVLLMAVSVSNAQLKLIHYWNFNRTMPLSGGGGTHFSSVPADYSTLGGKVLYTAIGKIVVPADTGYMDNLVGDTINQRPGYGFDTLGAVIQSGVRTRNPSDSMEFLWYIPTTNYKNIVITYETEKSGSGMNEEGYSYSLDSGATFITTGLPMAYDSAQGAWNKVTLNLSTITAMNSNPRLVFRITYTGPSLSACNCTASNGNDRYDNITVEGDTAPMGINEIEARNSEYSVFPNPTTDNVTISGTFDGTKQIIVYNILGEPVLTTTEENRQFNLNTVALNTGMYFVNVKELRTGNTYILKFIKN